MRGDVGTLQIVAHKLGADHSLQARGWCRKHTAMATRIKQHSTRIRCLKSLATGMSVRYFYHSGIKPVVAYGWELCPPRPAELASLSAKSVDVHGYARSGLPATLVLAVHDTATSPDLDALAIPLCRLAKEFWLLRSPVRPPGALRFVELAALWRRRRALGSAWPRRKGALHPTPSPLGAIVAAIRRLKWEWEAPRVLRTDQGRTLDLTLGPPCQLLYRVRLTLARREATTWAAAHLPGFTTPQALDLLSHLWALRRVARPPAQQFRTFLAAFFGVAATPAWLCLHRLGENPTCPQCGLIADLHHHFHGCGDQLGRAQKRDQCCITLSRSAPAVPDLDDEDGTQCSARGQTVSWSSFQLRPADGPICIDGSSVFAQHGSITAAAAAVVQGDPLRGYKQRVALVPADFTPGAPPS
jgi:hypothetical protein